MNQSDLWHDTILDAIGAAVQASGGIKRVSAQLWPTLGDTAAQRLRCCLNADHAQKLCPLELDTIVRLAAAVGDYSIPKFVALAAHGQFEALSADEAKKRERKARIAYHMGEAQRLMSEAE